MKKHLAKIQTDFHGFFMRGTFTMTTLFASGKTAIAGTLLLLLLLFSCTKNASFSEPVVSNSVSQPSTFPATEACLINTSTLLENALINAGWFKAFYDDFDTQDLSKWDIITGGGTAINQNSELQYYHASNLKVIDGSLNIIVRKPSPQVQGFDYTSGRIESKTYFSANSAAPSVRIYARIKLPAGYGMWPAFWTYGNAWPTNGEIDILEARGQDHTKYQTNYAYGAAINTNQVSGAEHEITATGEDLTSCYHVYMVEWTQNELNFYRDGALIETKAGGQIPSFFTKSQRITLNVAVGGIFFSGLIPTDIRTGTMCVDWVKVFTR